MFRCECQKSPTMMPTDCSVRCTSTILPSIRISWDYHPTFMLISGRVQGLSSTYEQAHVDLDLLTLASCLNYHLLFCYVYTILCISRIFCCICNFFPSERSKCSKIRKQPRYGVYIFFLCKRTIFEVYKRCWSTKRKKLSDDIE